MLHRRCTRGRAPWKNPCCSEVIRLPWRDAPYAQPIPLLSPRTLLLPAPPTEVFLISIADIVVPRDDRRKFCASRPGAGHVQCHARHYQRRSRACPHKLGARSIRMICHICGHGIDRSTLNLRHAERAFPRVFRTYRGAFRAPERRAIRASSWMSAS